MPSFWQQMPFVRILIAFVMGIIWTEHFSFSWLNGALLALAAFVSIILTRLFSKTINSPLQLGLAYFTIFICLGACCLKLDINKQHLGHFSAQNYSAILVQITQKPQFTHQRWKAEAEIIACYTEEKKAIPCSGKLLLFGKNTPALPAHYGNQFLIKSGIQEIVANNNPGGFNFRTFMQRKGIFHQCFLAENSAILFRPKQGNTILQQVFTFQDYIHQSLQKNLSNKNEIAIAEALLYGYDKDIDEEINDAFSKTGTLHVLAVSGMHVGLIFMLLNWLMSWLVKLPHGKGIKAILELFGIWLYALICGLSPSILRACVMFSFVIVGKQLSRSSNPFNSLSAAGFLLLAIKPYMLYNVGFQLSFAAVAGILGFYPFLNLLFQFKYTLFNEIWKIIAISLAAQTLTIPISIYYFHQFPNYFLLANLLIIPLSTLIIYGGIMLLIISPIQILATWLGFLLGKLITLITGISLFLAQLPYSSIDSIIWSIPSICAYYLIGIACIQYFSSRNSMAIQSILLILIVLAFFGLNRSWTNHKRNSLCIYARKHSLVLQVQQSYTLQIWHRGNDSAGIKEKLVRPYLMVYPATHQKWHSLDSTNYCLTLPSKQKLYVLQQSCLSKNLDHAIVLLAGKKPQNLMQLLDQSKPQQVILHSDIPLYRKKIYITILQKKQIPYHDITENGAFELSL